MTASHAFWATAAALLLSSTATLAAPPTGPSFSCKAVAPGSIAALVCSDPKLSALDRQLAQVFAQARAKAKNERPPVLQAEQRGWIKGRDDCWKAQDNRAACVAFSYERRIVELQARYRLVPARGPVRWACDGNDANELVVTHFETQPASLIAERGDSQSLMVQVPSASGSKYEGRNELLWEHQGEATVRWGYQAPEMRCRPK